MMKLGVVVASVREKRAGLPIASWFAGVARAHAGFSVTLIDLKELKLPLLQEPNHPRLRQYTQQATKDWSETVAGMDAFVFVTPEYNHGSPPALVNALDYLFVEWHYKAAGFVSYGGISGGIRSVQMIKPILTALKMMPLFEAVHIPFFTQFMDAESGVFLGNESHQRAATAMLDELARWTGALAALRA
jgi:NAD(P)H-dependent FMN reductase